MSKFGSAWAVLAGAGVVVLAGCGASGSPGVAAGSTSSAATTSPSASASASATSDSNTLVTTGSVPYPIAVGNTWVYKTTASINSENGTETNKVLAVVPVPGGHKVTMSETTDIAGKTTTQSDVFTFYSNGTIAYPMNGAVSVEGDGIVWPNAAQLASGKAFHSVLRVNTGQPGASQYQDANVTVQGAGTDTVTVPAGTYQATKVIMTVTEKVGSYSSTVETDTWQAAGTGPVKTTVSIHAGGNVTASSTEVLLSFTKG
jgi:hypothetical protein